jgi:hypothetical protein
MPFLAGDADEVGVPEAAVFPIEGAPGAVLLEADGLKDRHGGVSLERLAPYLFKREVVERVRKEHPEPAAP